MMIVRTMRNTTTSRNSRWGQLITISYGSFWIEGVLPFTRFINP
jgi:hypothetical protein